MREFLGMELFCIPIGMVFSWFYTFVKIQTIRQKKLFCSMLIKQKKALFKNAKFVFIFSLSFHISWTTAIISNRISSQLQSLNLFFNELMKHFYCTKCFKVKKSDLKSSTSFRFEFTSLPIISPTLRPKVKIKMSIQRNVFVLYYTLTLQFSKNKA